ncbi:hypothetical protein [Methanobrevibacter sp.]|uniref:hypothetical protein n=1 Tax=Methanobrevibacter sp. TaxID=66852 RepID=UPI00388E66F1
MDTNALTNAVLSFIIPGLGQAINGYKKKGLILFIIVVLLNLTMYYFLNNPLGHVINTLYRLYAGYDAYKTY